MHSKTNRRPAMRWLSMALALSATASAPVTPGRKISGTTGDFMGTAITIRSTTASDGTREDAPSNDDPGVMEQLVFALSARIDGARLTPSPAFSPTSAALEPTAAAEAVASVTENTTPIDAPGPDPPRKTASPTPLMAASLENPPVTIPAHHETGGPSRSPTLGGDGASAAKSRPTAVTTTEGPASTTAPDQVPMAKSASPTRPTAAAAEHAILAHGKTDGHFDSLTSPSDTANPPAAPGGAFDEVTPHAPSSPSASFPSPAEVPAIATSGEDATSNPQDQDDHGCPRAFNESSRYEEGDIVTVRGKHICPGDTLCHVRYRCRPWPDSAYCNRFVPGKRNSGKGWVELGRCTRDPSANDSKAEFLPSAPTLPPTGPSPPSSDALGAQNHSATAVDASNNEPLVAPFLPGSSVSSEAELSPSLPPAAGDASGTTLTRSPDKNDTTVTSNSTASSAAMSSRQDIPSLIPRSSSPSSAPGVHHSHKRSHRPSSSPAFTPSSAKIAATPSPTRKRQPGQSSVWTAPASDSDAANVTLVKLPRIICDITLPLGMSQNFEHTILLVMRTILHELFHAHLPRELYSLAGLSLDVEVRRDEDGDRSMDDGESPPSPMARLQAFFTGSASFLPGRSPALNELAQLLIKHFDLDDFNRRLEAPQQMARAATGPMGLITVYTVFVTLEDGTLMHVGRPTYEAADTTLELATTLTPVGRDGSGKVQVGLTLTALVAMACAVVLILYQIHSNRKNDGEEEDDDDIEFASEDPPGGDPARSTTREGQGKAGKVEVEIEVPVHLPSDAMSDVSDNSAVSSSLFLSPLTTPSQSPSFFSLSSASTTPTALGLGIAKPYLNGGVSHLGFGAEHFWQPSRQYDIYRDPVLELP